MAFRPQRYRIYKRLPFGAMADVFLLDERQYRVAGAAGSPRQMLGESQMRWLINGLRRSKARWKIIAQQVVVANIFWEDGGGLNLDAWDGFAEDRARLLGAIERAGIENVVFLSGDAHVFMANLLGTDFPAVAAGRARPAATEFVGGSVTSRAGERSEADIQRRAPWNRQFDSIHHGYSHLDLADDRMVVEYREADVSVPEPPLNLLARFVQGAGTNAFGREV
jgi:alkaline phosphatase D